MKTSVFADWRDRALAFGLEQVSRDSCPLALVGVRCKGYEPLCWCRRDRSNDHGATYLDVQTGERIVMWEPYGITTNDIDGLRRLYGSLGIEVTVTNRSTWYPGETVAIEFRPERQQ